MFGYSEKKETFLNFVLTTFKTKGKLALFFSGFYTQQMCIALTCSTHRGCFRGIWYFMFIARHQVSVCCNVLNQLKQSGERVRTRPHMDCVVRHAQFHLGMTLNKRTNGVVEHYFRSYHRVT